MKVRDTVVILFLNFFMMIAGHAQQDAQFSQYMFNGLLINPALAGSKEQISTSMLYRRQWIGVGIAPAIKSFNIHAPFRFQRVGLGLYVNDESFSIHKRLSISAIYAYKINFAQGILSFGISGGIIQSSLKYSELNVSEEEKPYIKNDINTLLPDLGTGLSYRHTKFYLAVSALHLLQSDVKYSTYPLSIDVAKRHFYVMAGYRWQIAGKLEILPSMLFKYINNRFLQADFTTHIKYNDLVWAGISFRTNNAMSMQTGLKISELIKLTRQSIKIGYAYDWSNNGLNLVSKGSHEVMLIFELGIYQKPAKIRKEKINISPVFF